jgi:pyruvate/2-oxoglutarate dehydrogenase complex dihydrolipoamide acyltransferase (E2) component
MLGAMSTPDDAVPAPAAPVTPAPADSAASQSLDDLSPAVRRLVRQFDLDVKGIHGTGPAGRIRVSDVIGMLGGRTDSGNRDAAPRPPPPEYDESQDAVEVEAPPSTVAEVALSAVGAPLAFAPSTSVFDCDLGRVLLHRKRLRDNNVDLLLASYFLTAVAEALPAAPELTTEAANELGLVLSAGDGVARTSVVDLSASEGAAVLEQRLRSIDAALRTNIDTPVTAAGLLVYHYGESGSILTAPTPIAAEHPASVGIGRVRREIVVRSMDGVESPRVAARCYVTLSFRPERIDLHRANRFLAHAVRVLEQWPE